MLLNFSSIESKNMNANYFAKLLQMMINNFLVRREIGKNLLEKKKPVTNRLFGSPTWT